MYVATQYPAQESMNDSTASSILSAAGLFLSNHFFNTSSLNVPRKNPPNSFWIFATVLALGTISIMPTSMPEKQTEIIDQQVILSLKNRFFAVLHSIGTEWFSIRRFFWGILFKFSSVVNRKKRKNRTSPKIFPKMRSSAEPWCRRGVAKPRIFWLSFAVYSHLWKYVGVVSFTITEKALKLGLPGVITCFITNLLWSPNGKTTVY